MKNKEEKPSCPFHNYSLVVIFFFIFYHYWDVVDLFVRLWELIDIIAGMCCGPVALWVTCECIQ